MSGPTPQAAAHAGAGPSVDELEGAEERSYAWIFMRLSGVLLVVLAGLTVADRYLVNDVEQVTALSLALRWRNGWWRLADFAFVVLATGHALVGLHWTVRRRFARGTGLLAAESVGAVVLCALGLLAARTVMTFGS